ncbi:hypothetical protein D3C83_59520 [compost metagenome]
MTRTKLLAVNRSPSVCPERPSVDRANMSITVSGTPMPMPSPNRNDTSMRTAMWLKNGTSANPIAPAKNTQAISVSAGNRLTRRARNSRTMNEATARLARMTPIAEADIPIECP